MQTSASANLSAEAAGVLSTGSQIGSDGIHAASALRFVACGALLLLTLLWASSTGKTSWAFARKHSSFSPAIVDTKRNAIVVHNLVYSKNHASIEQTLDLYLPVLEKPPYPLIIWVHGGTWMYGDKNLNCAACDHLLGKYAVASVNYRLDTEAPFPAQIYDLKAAVRYLRAHAKQYKLNPKLIGVWGVSAGGQLAALLGTSGGVKELEGDEGNEKYSSRVQAVCEWAGPSDFNTAQEQASPSCKIRFQGRGSPIWILMGGKMDSKSLAAASPVTYVSADDPPFFIMHGDIDDAIPWQQSQELYDKLRKAGVDAKLYYAKGFGHGLDVPYHFKMAQTFFDEKLLGLKSKP